MFVFADGGLSRVVFSVHALPRMRIGFTSYSCNMSD